MSSLNKFGSFVDNEHKPLVEKAFEALKSLQGSVDEHGVILEDKLEALLAGSKIMKLFTNNMQKLTETSSRRIHLSSHQSSECWLDHSQ